MGNYNSKENVAVAQAQVNTGELTNKLNNMGLLLIILATIVVGTIIFGMRQHYHQRVKTWLRREVVLANANPPVVCVQTVPQQPATAAAAPPSAGITTAYI